MAVINEFLQRDKCTNGLMAGINVTAGAKKNSLERHELKVVLKDVAASFLSLLRTNKMLAIEMLFEFPSKDLKDAILSNYE